MAFIPNNNGHKIGDWVLTRKEHKALIGTFTAGSYVKITDVDPMRGYAIEDKYGNCVREIGWII